jgi:hypothetical protein
LRFVVSAPLVQRVSPNGLYRAGYSSPPLAFVAREIFFTYTTVLVRDGLTFAILKTHSYILLCAHLLECGVMWIQAMSSIDVVPQLIAEDLAIY